MSCLGALPLVEGERYEFEIEEGIVQPGCESRNDVITIDNLGSLVIVGAFPFLNPCRRSNLRSLEKLSFAFFPLAALAFGEAALVSFFSKLAVFF